MTQIKYLNVILTINAVLLAALVWSQVGAGPGLDAVASAQTAAPDDAGIPNAASQRQQIVEAIRRLDGKVEATNRLLSGGRLKVQVANLAELGPQSPNNAIGAPLQGSARVGGQSQE